MSAWKIEFSDAALRDLRKLDKQTHKRTMKFLEHRVAEHPDPKQLAKKLQGKNNKNLWRYRVGDYRIIVRFKDNLLVVMVLEIDHRKHIYR